ncbi:MAG: ATP-dependent helicase [Deltaproteobacteria bacterium]|nr:ATP-dependent helicase [Deltaproteobacteria bacterium]
MAEDLSRFNPSQREAILSSSGALLILAGPGTGKTSVLIAKISQLIQSGIKPEKILAITFSRKATLEIEDRLSHTSGSSNVNVSTLHAFCADLVQRHGFRLGLKQKVRMMTEAESHLFFRQMSGQLPLQPFMKTSNFEPIIDDLLEFFQKAKDEGLWPEDIIRFASDMPNSTSDEEQIKSEWMALGDLYNAYQGFCFEKGFIDFGDSVLCALRILQDFAIVREEVQKSYDALLIDEFQDTNWTQIQLLKMIASPTAHIAAVGDDDQSIYRFRGASYSAFQFFKDLFPNLKTVELDQTYRLSPEILDAASELIRANGDHRFRADKKLKSTKKSQGAVKLIKASSFEDEAIAVADEIQKLLDSGTKPNSIGVLVRAHSHADFLLAEAKKRNLPLEAKASLMLFDQEIVRDVMAFFKILMRPDDSISFLRLLDSVFLRFSADDIYKICRSTSGKTPVIEILEKSNDLEISDSAKNSLKEFFELYKSLHGLSFRKSASEILLQIYQQSKAIAFLLENDTQTLKILGRFHSQLAEWEKIQPEKELQHLFPLLESFARRELTLDEEGSTDVAEDRIPVLTVHASKGLEFENVFILSLVGRRFPQNFRQATWKFPENLEREPSGTKEMHNEEERRLFYVAMTRAKNSLTLTTIEKKGTRPSSFITEDLKNLLPRFDVIERPSSATETFLTPQRDIFSRIKKPEMKVASPVQSLKLSFTQLDKYETCPLQYRFTYDIKIPVPSSPSLLVGAAVHSALEKFFLGIKNGNEPIKENLITYFDNEFLNLQKDNAGLSAFDHNLGREKLGAYFDLHEEKFPIPFAVEQPFRLQIGEHLVTGKIDRADQTKDGIVIIDYKTGKSKSNENAKDRKFADESLQLSIYALAAKEVLGWNLKELVLYYIYDNQSLSSTRTDKDLEVTKERILKIASQIQAQNFDAKPGFHCQWCEFRSLCPFAE